MKPLLFWSSCCFSFLLWIDWVYVHGQVQLIHHVYIDRGSQWSVWITGFSTSAALEHITWGRADCDPRYHEWSSDWLKWMSVFTPCSYWLFHQHIHLKTGFIAILMTSQWRMGLWRTGSSFSMGAFLVLKHSHVVSPHEINGVALHMAHQFYLIYAFFIPYYPISDLEFHMVLDTSSHKTWD